MQQVEIPGVGVVPVPPDCREILQSLPYTIDEANLPVLYSGNYYEAFAALGAFLAPRSILEIGVRYGYSAISLGIGSPHRPRYVGIDDQSYPIEFDDPPLPTNIAAKINIHSTGRLGDVEIHTAKSIDALPLLIAKDERFDLIHVDGSHTYTAALRDILLSVGLMVDGGTILVDDMIHPPVAKAVKDSGLPHVIIETDRRLAVIRCSREQRSRLGTLDSTAHAR